MTPRTRNAALSAFLVSSTVPLAWTVGRRHGSSAGWRFGAGMGGSLLAQQALVGLALGRYRSPEDEHWRHALSLVDAITLSRGATGALSIGLFASGVRDRRGPAGWLG